MSPAPRTGTPDTWVAIGIYPGCDGAIAFLLREGEQNVVRVQAVNTSNFVAVRKLLHPYRPLHIGDTVRRMVGVYQPLPTTIPEARAAQAAEDAVLAGGYGLVKVKDSIWDGWNGYLMRSIADARVQWPAAMKKAGRHDGLFAAALGVADYVWTKRLKVPEVPDDDA